MFDGEDCIRCEQHFKFEDLIYLTSGLGMCRECHAKVDPAKESERTCPKDGSRMKKEIVQEKLMIDSCPTCGGIWIDGDEVAIMRQIILAEDRKHDTHFLSILFPFVSR